MEWLSDVVTRAQMPEDWSKALYTVAGGSEHPDPKVRHQGGQVGADEEHKGWSWIVLGSLRRALLLLRTDLETCVDGWEGAREGGEKGGPGNMH